MEENTVIFLEPYLDEKIWGGDVLKEFGFKLPSNKIGEAWLISALKNKASKVINADFNKMSFDFFYNEYRDSFFNGYQNAYPLLTKIIDANDNLSVQVHPDDYYAKKHEKGSGKTECWYILNSKKNAKIVYGHRAMSKKMMKEMVKKDQWSKLLMEKSTKQGDFFFTPAGLIHAIGKGNLVFELQQSSDITYRLFDYHRKDDNGKARELHLQKAFDVISFPFKKPLKKDYCQKKGYLVDFSLFKLKKINLKKQLFIRAKKWWIQGTIIDGKCKVNGLIANKGMSFVSKANHTLKLEGNATLLLSWI